MAPDTPSKIITPASTQGLVNAPMTIPQAPAEAAAAQRDRRAMLAQVRATWIDDVLEGSLATGARLELGMHLRPDMVALSRQADVHDSNESIAVVPAERTEALPAETTITEVYDRCAGTLLILGEPGGGKTTTLLELTRDLLTRADQDDGQPIPVVFNLSSWGVRPRPLAQWLVDELWVHYEVPQRRARAWMHADGILPLLDGLDEVIPTQQVACVAAINAFRQAHEARPLVVCSRLEDYT